jgi:hypothetical protein
VQAADEIGCAILAAIPAPGETQMFMGHYSAAFAAKRVVPAIPLPVWFIACQIIDLCWGMLVLLDVEKLRVIPHFTATNGLDLYFMPYTHSLPAALVWSLAAALLFLLLNGPAFPRRVLAAVVFGAVVASHWALDWVVHTPDLPLWFGGTKVGLGLWNYRYPALLLELVLLWLGVWLSLPVAAQNRRRYLWLATVMSVVQLLSLPLQPPGEHEVASHLLATYLLLTAAAWWVSRTRAPAQVTAAAAQ